MKISPPSAQQNRSARLGFEGQADFDAAAVGAGASKDGTELVRRLLRQVSNRLQLLVRRGRSGVRTSASRETVTRLRHFVGDRRAFRPLLPGGTDHHSLGSAIRFRSLGIMLVSDS